VRAPLSWLRDFAPFPDDVEALRAALDDLGLVVEAVEHIGEGLGDVVVSRVLEIRPIKGADKIRRVLVDAGLGEPVEIVCGAHNFEVGDRVPLAPVGAILFVAGIFVTCLLAAWGMGTITGAFVPALGWIAATFGLSQPMSSGSVIIANTSAGKWYLYGGMIGVAAALLLSFAARVRLTAR